MKKSREQIRRIFWICLILGSMAIGVGRAMFDLSEFVFIAWLTIVALGSIIIDLLWYRGFNQKLNQINLILNEQYDPDQYITELDALMEGTRSLPLRQLHLINLGAAHIHKKEYEKAKSLFLEAKVPKLSKINKVIYWADLALIYFYLKDEKSACAIMEAQKNNFEKFKDHKQVADTLAIVAIFHLLAMGEKKTAKHQLDEARGRWENKRNTSDFLYLESLIED